MYKKIAGLLAGVAKLFAVFGIIATMVAWWMKDEEFRGFVIEVAASVFPDNAEDQPTEIDRLVDERYTLEESWGTRGQVQSCKQHLRTFNKASHLTRVPVDLLIGIATIESGGCKRLRSDDGGHGFMQVTVPDDRHVARAATLLGLKVGKLDWKGNAEHNVVLGAVMYDDYHKRLMRKGDASPSTHALEAYNQGLGNVDTDPNVGNTYILRVLAARRMAGENEYRDGRQIVAIDDRR